MVSHATPDDLSKAKAEDLSLYGQLNPYGFDKGSYCPLRWGKLPFKIECLRRRL